MRVHELAKQIGISSKDLMQQLSRMGVSVKNHMSTLTEEEAERVLREHSASSGAKAPKAKKAKSATASGGKKARVAAPEPEPDQRPPKRTHLLIKKKPAPVPAEEEAGAEKPEEKPLEPAAALETQGEAASAEAAASAPETPPVSEVPAVKEEGAEELAEAKPEGGEAVEAPKAVEGAVRAPGETKEAPEKGKVKKPKKAKLEPETERFDFRKELSRLEVFRPTHRRDERHRAGLKRGQPSPPSEVTKPRKKVVKLSPGLTIKEFAELIGQKATTVIGKLMKSGVMTTINQPIDLELAALIAEEFGVRTEVMAEQTEEELLPVVEDTAESLTQRPPVVTIMGHVDHGKTSLLDAIRQARVTESEAGGITQHIGAYVVPAGEKRITFLDTPGHEAFTAMRARGAKVTDIVVLVVAADDGVMPQTMEAINHSKAAGVPIVVAINKIDKPEANPDRVRGSLAERGLVPEAWGGQTIYVEVSAKQKINLDLLLEMILLQAEVMELKATSDKPARGVIIEAKLDRGRGPVATVLIQEGTLKVGDVFVTGFYSGKVRALIDDLGNRIESAGPSIPVEVIGLEGVPQAGDSFIVTAEERLAREIANNRQQKQRLAAMAQAQKVSLEDMYRRIQEGTVKELKLVLKADVQGSVEAIGDSLQKIKSDVVKVNVIHTGVGGITESDVLLASASEAIVIGFNVRPDSKALAVIEKEKVDVRLYTVIYDAISDIQAAMEGLLEPTLKEKFLGRAEVRQTFNISRIGTVAGCYVSEGLISRNSAGARVIRDNVVIYEGKLSSLKRFKDDVREVQTGFECGISIENFNDIKPGDVIEVYAVEEVAAKL